MKLDVKLSELKDARKLLQQSVDLFGKGEKWIEGAEEEEKHGKTAYCSIGAINHLSKDEKLRKLAKYFLNKSINKKVSLEDFLDLDEEDEKNFDNVSEESLDDEIVTFNDAADSSEDMEHFRLVQKKFQHAAYLALKAHYDRKRSHKTKKKVKQYNKPKNKHQSKHHAYVHQAY